MENLKNVAPIEDFNWDAYENGESFAGASHEELEKAYDGTLNKVNDREVVDGTVIAMNKREVVVNIGYKSDGIIPLNEFRYNPDLKVGDTVEVYIENQEDKKGQLVLSHRKARATRSWDRVNAALENEEIIKGYIKCRTKGGMIVDVFGIEAFLPGSQIDVKPIRDYDVFVGKTMEFKVVKINQEFKNVVVSHKALIEAELEQQKKEIIGKLEKGQVLEGTVKNITSYGVFIDLGGVDGLIHITDLSWGRVSDPKEVVELDQKLNATQVDEYTIRCDILNGSFKNLSFFELTDNFFLLLFQFSFDKSFVRNNHVFEFLVDFNHFEFHCFANKYIIVTDRFHVDLRTRQECFDTEYVNDHTTLSATLDVTLDNFFVFQSSINAIPRASSASFSV